MSTFLELCQDYRAELGIPGNGPVTTVGQVGELARVITDIRNADLDIQNKWQDWRFLWTSFSANTIAGNRWLTTTKPSDLGTWNTNSFYLDKSSTESIHLTYIDYDEWRDTRVVGESTTGDPDAFTVLPDGSIYLDPVPDTVMALTAEYWKKPAPLTSNAQVSIIPEEWHRLIVVRAKIYYAEREDAPEIMVGAVAEYDDLMTGLEAGYLRGQGDGRQARVIRPRQMVIE